MLNLIFTYFGEERQESMMVVYTSHRYMTQSLQYNSIFAITCLATSSHNERQATYSTWIQALANGLDSRTEDDAFRR